MKKQLMFMVVALAAFCASAEEDVDGGVLTMWPKNHGRFLFVNAQKTVPSSTFAGIAKALAAETSYDISLVEGTAPEIKDVSDALTRLGAKGAIWIVDDAAYPLTLGACEDGWGFLNVGKAKADQPDAAKLARRLVKLAYRLFGNVNGAGATSESPHCVMETAYGLKAIDEISCAELSPFALMKISGFFAKAGYKAQLIGTYYDACEAGWAPLPTNDVQKSIWAKIHKMPTNPIKILPESQRKK